MPFGLGDGFALTVAYVRIVLKLSLNFTELASGIIVIRMYALADE